MILRFAALLALAILAAPAHAAERNYLVTDFDQIEMTGPFQVTVETGKSGSAKAIGALEALDSVLIEVRSRRLIIRPLQNRWKERGAARTSPILIQVGVPALVSASMTGSGSLNIGAIRAWRLTIGQSGTGQVKVGPVDTSVLTLMTAGAGNMEVSGKAFKVIAGNAGTGTISAKGLAVTQLELNANSAGRSDFAASRSAKVVQTGTGPVTIEGTQNCTVQQRGQGVISCGREKF